MTIHERVWDEEYTDCLDVEEIAGGVKLTLITGDDANEIVINAAQSRKLRLMLTRMERKGQV